MSLSAHINILDLRQVHVQMQKIGDYRPTSLIEVGSPRCTLVKSKEVKNDKECIGFENTRGLSTGHVWRPPYNGT